MDSWGRLVKGCGEASFDLVSVLARCLSVTFGTWHFVGGDNEYWFFFSITFSLPHM